MEIATQGGYCGFIACLLQQLDDKSLIVLVFQCGQGINSPSYECCPLSFLSGRHYMITIAICSVFNSRIIPSRWRKSSEQSGNIVRRESLHTLHRHFQIL